MKLANSILVSSLFVLACLDAVIASPVTISKRATGVYINPNGVTTLCLAIPVPDAPANGVSPKIILCSDTQTTNPNAAGYALWDISYGNNAQGVRLSGTNFCLDAGENPDSIGTSIGTLKIWQCYPGLKQQTYYLTDDQHLAVTGGTSCLTQGRYGTYLTQCYPDGTALVPGSQLFTLSPGPSGTTPSPPPATTTPATNPGGGSNGGGGKRIHPTGVTQGEAEVCLTVGGGVFVNGAVVNVATCFSSSDGDLNQFQTWNINRGAGPVTTAGGAYCLDFGSGPGTNGVGMKIWQCYPTLFQQQMYYTDDNHIAVLGGNQCLDVTRESTYAPGSPYGKVKDVQSWQCSGTDPLQVWTTSSV